MNVRLEVLAGARLVKAGVAIRLERRTAAVLAYLALEGEAVKYRLAAWLWPDSSDNTAHNNMRQLLRRLRNLCGLEVIVGENRIQLAPFVTADASEIQARAFAGDHAGVLEFGGELLDGYEYDDCPDFEEWMRNARDGLSGLRRHANAAESDRLEQSGEFADAIKFALECLRLEPLSEGAHRRLMRLHFLNGDRAAALAVFAQLERSLKLELGVEPLLETLELMRQIERGGLPTPAPRAVPFRVLHPPSLVGREREWAQLEAAWAAGQAIFISGEPGAGKSRLAQDFAASKGSVFRFSARPGDALVPFSSQARGLRESLAAQPELRDQLPDWVRSELSRLLPELNSGEPLPPLTSESEKLRFYAAIGTMVGLSRHEDAVTVSDDVQFVDRASGEIMAYLLGEGTLLGKSNHPRQVNVFRRGELSDEFEAMVAGLLDAGLAVRIELEPLALEAVDELLAGLDLPEATDFGPALVRYTGGNPLFMLETLKHLLETGQLQHGWPGRLPPPGKVGPLVQRRLERLSETARRLAWACAILGSDNTVERAAKTLETNPLDLAEAWAELERSEVLRGTAFSHDLVFEAALGAIPGAIRGLLHRRVAQMLETDLGSPARIAEHWLEGGQGGSAAPWLVKAAEQAAAAYRLGEATDFYRRAAAEYLGHQQPAAAFAALYALSRFSYDLKDRVEANLVLDQLLEIASTPRERAQAWHARSVTLGSDGHYAEHEAAARTGLEFLRENSSVQDGIQPRDDRQLEVLLLRSLGTALWYQSRFTEALEQFEPGIQLAETLPETLAGPQELIGLLHDAATTLGDLNRIDEATAYLKRLETLSAKSNDRVLRIQVLSNLAKFEVLAGRSRAAIQTLLEARNVLENLDGQIELKLTVAQALCATWRMREEYALALDGLEAAIGLAERDAPSRYWLLTLRKDRALVLLNLGAETQAETELLTVLADPEATVSQRGICLYTLAALRARRGEPDSDQMFKEAEKLLEPSKVDRAFTAAFLIARGPSLPPAESLTAAQNALEIAEQIDRDPLRIAALIRLAQANLELGLPAQIHSDRAMQLYETCEIAGLERAEVLLTHARVLAANHDPGATQAFAMARRWVFETADQRVPQKHRQGFLERNRSNQAVLEYGHSK
jgi:DNA-binding SARP family transcriptional activator